MSPAEILVIQRARELCAGAVLPRPGVSKLEVGVGVFQRLVDAVAALEPVVAEADRPMRAVGPKVVAAVVERGGDDITAECGSGDPADPPANSVFFFPSVDVRVARAIAINLRRRGFEAEVDDLTDDGAGVFLNVALPADSVLDEVFCAL